MLPCLILCLLAVLDGKVNANEVKSLFTGDGMDEFGIEFPAKKKPLVPREKLETEQPNLTEHIKSYRFASGPHGVRKPLSQVSYKSHLIVSMNQ